MNVSVAAFASSRIIYLILVPLLREFAGVLLAIAISKDCKARGNGSGALWGLFTLIAPAMAGIIYGVYSRILEKRQPKTDKDKKKVKRSRKLTIWAIFVYVVAILVAGIAFITTVASGAAMFINEDGSSPYSFNSKEYYDMKGNVYDNEYKVVLYDKQGNSYHIDESPNGWNYDTYFDQNATEYDIDLCYISKDGYFYYDKDSKLQNDDGLLTYEYDKIYLDENANEYKKIGECAFFDKYGKVVNRYYLGRHVGNYYAFE